MKQFRAWIHIQSCKKQSNLTNTNSTSKHLNGRFKGTCPSGVILSVRPIFHNLFLAQSCANVFTVPYSALRDNPSHIVDTDIDTDLLQGLEHRVKEIIGQRPQLLPLRDRTGHNDDDMMKMTTTMTTTMIVMIMMMKMMVGKTVLHYCADNLAPICPSLLLAAQA